MYTNINLHCHTDASLNDGAMTVKDYVKRAKEMDMPAAAITDHGGCQNWLDFYNEAKAKGIKPILGVEAYIDLDVPITDNFSIKKRPHLLLLAKNYAGMQEISLFVSETNRNFISGKPCGTIDMLYKFFKGHHNVIATSACVGGVIATPLSFNRFIDKEIAKINKRIAASSEKLSDGLQQALIDVENADREIAVYKEEIEKFTPKATAVIMTKKRIKEENPDLKQQELLIEAAEIEKIEKKEARDKIASLKSKISKITADNKSSYALVKKNKDKLATIRKNEEENKRLEASKKDDNTILRYGRNFAEEYKKIFGKDFYCEIQYHGIDVEKEIYPKIVEVAKSLDIPLVATNDCHMVSKDDLLKRLLLQNVGIISQKDRSFRQPIDGDDELYIKTGDELAETLSKIFPDDVVNEAMENIKVIANQCNLELSDEKHYPRFENAKQKLRDMCEKGIPERYPVFPEEYRKKLEYELKIIDQMGFNDYFCEVADFIQYAKDHGDNSVEIGWGRGSAVGSITCYLCKITNIDPMKYNLLFERFLNPHRVSMPDIDTDFSAHARALTIKYVKEKYGERAVANIMTKNRMAAKSALEYAPKLYGLRYDNDKSKYMPLYKQMRKLIGDEPNAKLCNYETILRTEFENNETALKIIDYAMMIEGYITSYGTHAAGIIITDGSDVENYIPLMKSEDDDHNEVYAVQADMVQCEAQLGFIKMDFLGLKNLNAITIAMHLITERHGIKIDPDNLPFEDEIFQKIYAAGDTNFVFQVESEGMKSCLKQLNPTRFEDIVLAIAVYRPGPMDFIPEIINCKNTGKKSSFVEKFPILEDILKETYGFPVYQEQVMSIMTTAAGFDMGHADNVRRFMSKKKEDKLAHERPAFVQGCAETNGISEADANWLFDQLMPFAKYGFNKSHAVAYSYVSYVTAWLKYHYRVEYLCAIMAIQPEKTSQLTSDCKNSGITLYRPDINNSMAGFYPYKDGIIVGFTAIKGLKSAGQTIVDDKIKAGGHFSSIEDAIEKLSVGGSNVAKLVCAGAFDDFTDNREITATDVKEYAELYKKVKEKQNRILELQSKTVYTEKDELKRQNDIKSKESEIEALRKTLKGTIKKHVAPLSTEKRLLLEVEALDMWITGNPLEDYNVKGMDLLSDLISDDENGNSTFEKHSVKIGSVLTDVKAIKTKKGDKMAFVTITDVNGDNISGVCFPKVYEQYQPFIESGKISEIKGHLDTDNNGEPQIVIDQFKTLARQAKVILAVAKNIEAMTDIYDFAVGYKCDSLTDGMFVKIYTQEMRDISMTNFTVNPDVIGRLQECGYDTRMIAM